MNKKDLQELLKKHRPKKGPSLSDAALDEIAEIEIMNQFDDSRRRTRSEMREIVDAEVKRLTK